MKKQRKGEFDVRIYKNNTSSILRVVIGKKYGGEGCSGLTDGADVRGKLEKIDTQFSMAIILSDKLNMPCAVRLSSLYVL